MNKQAQENPADILKNTSCFRITRRSKVWEEEQKRNGPTDKDELGRTDAGQDKQNITEDETGFLGQEEGTPL